MSSALRRLAAFENGDMAESEMEDFIMELVENGEIEEAPPRIRHMAERMGMLGNGFQLYDITDAAWEEGEE